MAAGLVFVIAFFVAVKTASYGVWEMKRNNATGGGFAVFLAVFCIVLAGRYFIKYRA